jgi:hypothetical protein
MVTIQDTPIDPADIMDIDENTSIQLTLDYTDYNNNVIDPSLVSSAYSVYDVDSGTEIAGPTTFTGSNINIPPVINNLLNSDNNSESRKVVVNWTYNDGVDGGTTYFEYVIHSITPSTSSPLYNNLYMSIDEFKRLAKRRGVDLSLWEDPDLYDALNRFQSYMESYTGRIGKPRVIVEQFRLTRISGTSIKLKYYPVLPIYPIGFPDQGPYIHTISGYGENTGLIVDGVNINWYMLMPAQGVIKFDVPLFDWGSYWRLNNIQAVYTAIPYLEWTVDDYGNPRAINNPNAVEPIMKGLLGDITLHYCEMEVSGLHIAEEKDDSFVRRFFQESEWDIELDRLRRPLLEIIKG